MNVGEGTEDVFEELVVLIGWADVVVGLTEELEMTVEEIGLAEVEVAQDCQIEEAWLVVT